MFFLATAAFLAAGGAPIAAAYAAPNGSASPAVQKQDDQGDDDDSDNKNRFPQPVRVGDLIGRQVLEPTEAQHVLGRVAAVVRKADSQVDFIVAFGGVFGYGARLIAVPADAIALLGEHVAVLDYTPDQLKAFPTIETPGKTLSSNDVIKVGLTRPFH